MQSGWIEVCAIWPHQSMHFWIEAHFIEKLDIVERRIQFACECWLKVDRLNGTIVETDAKHVRSNDFKPSYFANRMTHIFYFKGSIGSGVLPSCNVFQSAISSC